MATGLSEFVGQELLWQPTAMMKARYELIAGDAIIASFDMSNWTNEAMAQTPEGMLIFNREGFWRPRVIVRSGDKAGPVLATFKQYWNGGGVLQFTDGRVYTWEKMSFWGMKRGWTDQTGQSVMGFAMKAMSRSTSVFIPPESAGVPDLSILAIAGLYINVLAQRDAAATSAAVTASI